MTQPSLELGPREITLNDMVACARRELEMRRRNYPRWVRNRQMDPEVANEEIARMLNIVALLERLQSTLTEFDAYFDVVRRDGLSTINPQSVFPLQNTSLAQLAGFRSAPDRQGGKR